MGNQEWKCHTKLDSSIEIAQEAAWLYHFVYKGLLAIITAICSSEVNIRSCDNHARIRNKMTAVLLLKVAYTTAP